MNVGHDNKHPYSFTIYFDRVEVIRYASYVISSPNVGRTKIMKGNITRHHIDIQANFGTWQQTNGRAHAWLCHVSILQLF